MNHIGKGGKSYNDRLLAARVRTLALEEIEKALKNKKNKRLYEAVLIKLAGSVLPRLNEHSGPDGQPIPIYGGLSRYTGDKESIPTEEEN